MSRHENSRHFAGERQDLVSLLRVWPDMAETLADDERRIAERVLIVPRWTAHDEDFAAAFAAETSAVFWLVVVEGTVLKETTLAKRSALELLGSCDVLAPPLSARRQLDSRAVSRYVALGDVSLAPLSSSFKRVAARFPPVGAFFDERLAEQAHRASMHLAMLHQPRAEDRILTLFTDLAERFGRVSAEGILIDLPLTHALIGRLIGSRRPTVSLALQSLTDDRLLAKLDGNRWKLTIEHARGSLA